LVFENTKLSYHELDLWSNKLANYLIEKGIEPGQNIGLLSLRGIEMIVAMFGILKTGNAYVPFNKEYPAERLEYIIEDAGIKVIVTTDSELLKASGLAGYESIHIKDALSASEKNPGVKLDVDTCVYIMYTSGTTGRPKGIQVNNRNITKLVYDTGAIAVMPEDRVLQWSNYSFDGSTYDIYSSLLKGATLQLIRDEWASDVDALSRVIDEQKITVCFMTTALFNSFIDVNAGALEGLRKILFGGEKVSISHASRALSILGSGKIVHVYGPTETTVYATSYSIDYIAADGAVPIGKPLSNTRLLVLNEKAKLVPVGVPGELYIGGDGVSMGYVNNIELTKEKFVSNPLNHQDAEEYYRSGDLVRWLPDGNIEYLGRIDSQVKIRGYRIELGEIESVLMQSGLVRQAVVLANEDSQGTKRLVSYVVPEKSFDKQATISYCRVSCPIIWCQHCG
jgi:amino acid adenylation domain-containing protein